MENKNIELIKAFIEREAADFTSREYPKEFAVKGILERISKANAGGIELTTYTNTGFVNIKLTMLWDIGDTLNLGLCPCGYETHLFKE